MIVIGAEVKGKAKTNVTIRNRDDIVRFFDDFKFGSERAYTVKHKLPAFIIIYMSNGKSAEIRFEKRIMRFNGKEYVLSDDTARLLEKKIKHLSNKALQLTGRSGMLLAKDAKSPPPHPDS